MCDVSNYAVRAVLGQRIDKHFKPIHYASKIINEAQENYTTTEMELLVVHFAFDKFHQYLVLSKTIFSWITLPCDLEMRTKVEIRDLFSEERLMEIFNKNNKPWERTKRWHDKWIEAATNYEKGDKVLLFNSCSRLFLDKLKSRWYGSFSVCKDMKNGAIELYDEDGNKLIVNKQRVKPYQKSVLDTNKDDGITLDDEGKVT
nr:retrovirus-related Pol polyprotein from transposon 297 family [Tanacetum cinerariifolium]